MKVNPKVNITPFVYRGGSWVNYTRESNSSTRFCDRSKFNFVNLGFRIVLGVKPCK